MAKFGGSLRTSKNQVVTDFPTYDDTEVKVSVRLLSALEDLQAMKAARAEAKAAGVENPTEGVPEYDLHLKAQLLYRCVGECSVVGDPTGGAFFESPKQILEHLDQDKLEFLYEFYQQFRDALNPQLTDLTPENIALMTHQLGGEGSPQDKLPLYLRCRAGLRFSYTIFLASLLKTSLSSSSSTGSPSTPDATRTTPV